MDFILKVYKFSFIQKFDIEVNTNLLNIIFQTEMGAAIVAGIEAGWVAPVINKEYNLEQAALVHHDIIHSNGAKGKLVLKVGNED
mgnify:FL=1